MKRNILKSALLIAFTALCGLSFSQEVNLSYNLQKGKTFVQNTKLSNTIIQSMGGNDIKNFMEMNLNAEILIEDIAQNGDITVIETLKDLSMHSLVMKVDTIIKFENINERSRVIYSKAGKLISRSILDSASVPGLSETSRQNWMYILLPGKMTKVGEQWNNTASETIAKSSTNPFETTTNSEFKYTFAGKESKDGKEFQKIEFEANLAVEGKGEQMGMEMFIEGTGKNKGFGYFDPNGSVVSYIEFETGLDMSITVSGQQNMSIPMSQNMKTVITLEEKK
ncbi:MAG: hypothetical protein AB7S48_08050 [Bacteroidales bacterium]